MRNYFSFIEVSVSNSNKSQSVFRVITFFLLSSKHLRDQTGKTSQTKLLIKKQNET